MPKKGTPQYDEWLRKYREKKGTSKPEINLKETLSKKSESEDISALSEATLKSTKDANLQLQVASKGTKDQREILSKNTHLSEEAQAELVKHEEYYTIQNLAANSGISYTTARDLLNVGKYYRQLSTKKLIANPLTNLTSEQRDSIYSSIITLIKNKELYEVSKLWANSRKNNSLTEKQHAELYDLYVAWSDKYTHTKPKNK